VVQLAVQQELAEQQVVQLAVQQELAEQQVVQLAVQQELAESQEQVVQLVAMLWTQENMVLGVV
jgi:hypothetical protein